jgi:hypothetical protein
VRLKEDVRSLGEELIDRPTVTGCDPARWRREIAEVVRAVAVPIEAGECEVPPEAQRRLSLVEPERRVLGEYRERRRLLELGDHDAGAYRVGEPGGQVIALACADLDAVHGVEHRVRILCVHPAAELVGLDVAREAEPDHGAGIGVHHDPSLRLSVPRAEVSPRGFARGVSVDGQALSGVEELDEQARLAALCEPGAEPGRRVFRDGVGEQRAVGEARHAGPRIRTGREQEWRKRRQRADPVLGAGCARLAAEAVDLRSAGVIDRNRVGAESMGAVWRRGHRQASSG